MSVFRGPRAIEERDEGAFTLIFRSICLSIVRNPNANIIAPIYQRLHLCMRKTGLDIESENERSKLVDR